MPVLVFPSEPFELKSVDPDFEAERKAANAAGFTTILVDTDEMRVASKGLTGPAVYRGWMLKPSDYELLDQLLKSRGLELITSPEAYLACHYLPSWYESFKDVTPRSLWFEGASPDTNAISEHFGGAALVLKDYVKSAKHYWKEACFIPRASDREALARVTERFLELRDGHPEGGLVYREFLEFQSIGKHQVSDMPLTLEFRLFFVKGKLLCSSRYWGDADYPEQEPPLDYFTELAQGVQSPFFSMDIAADTDGRWWVVEIGDAQVSGLPDGLDPGTFYGGLATNL